MRGVKQSRGKRFVQARKLLDRSGQLPHDRVHQAAGGQLRPREHEVPEADLLVNISLQETLVNALVAAAHEHELTQYAIRQLSLIPDMHIYGPQDGAAVVSFNVGNIHHLDMGTLLDRLGIAVRTGHHCAEPLMHRLGVEGTVRASFALYNTMAEVDALASGIDRVRQMF